MRIDGARDAKNASVAPELSGRTVADDAYVGHELRRTPAGIAGCGRSLFINYGLLHSAAQFHLQAFYLEWRSGANVDTHAGRFGDRVHRRPPADHADVERGLRLRRDSGLGEQMERVSQRHDWVG